MTGIKGTFGTILSYQSFIVALKSVIYCASYSYPTAATTRNVPYTVQLTKTTRRHGANQLGNCVKRVVMGYSGVIHCGRSGQLNLMTRVSVLIERLYPVKYNLAMPVRKINIVAPFQYLKCDHHSNI